MFVLYILFAIFALIIILAILAPRNYNIERHVIVNNASDDTFDYLKKVKNQDLWSPWKKRDPKMVQTQTGVDGTVGSINSWKSDHKQVGEGEQELILIDEENKRIESELRFFKPFKSVSTGYFLVKELESNKTEVTWGFKGVNKVPFNIMMLFYNMDKTVGKDFEEGLSDLKKILEN
ncbi:SRPBCC family protein [Ulvibacter antarcticus]|uniref:Polyketide cyclase/dehydrase/lipid transport protein n=1 Tax=Ulvibacter antarcticus TaxID=442714 RepID=A0A3L9Z2P5_9FLAO|nr:SRPBCC family protein [Ulvibacter antarcticus]RMA64618.1 polyketide cyclase/dehydrase/lipid transport protein [Ulvibacter antarcticus]